MAEINYKIIEPLGVLSVSENGEYTKEVNLISYNGGAVKLDIRKWDRRADRMQKGITLNYEEALILKKILGNLKER